jgi:hypothetical protein
MQVTAEQLKAAKAKDARARKITADVLGDKLEVVVRPPSRAEWKAFWTLRRNADDAKASAANEQLLTFCTLVPDPKSAEYSQLFDQYPGLADSIWTQVAQMGGMTAKIELGE